MKKPKKKVERKIGSTICNTDREQIFTEVLHGKRRQVDIIEKMLTNSVPRKNRGTLFFIPYFSPALLCLMFGNPQMQIGVPRFFRGTLFYFMRSGRFYSG